MASGYQWYGVKTVYRSARKGRPKGRDRRYVKSLTIVEERVVLVKARSFKEAIRKAEREASRYATDRTRNRYGQRIATRYVGYCMAYDMSPDKPTDAVEVFSDQELVPQSVSDDQVLHRLIGNRSFDRDVLLDNFGDVVFTGPAKGGRLSREERAFVARGREFMAKRKQDAQLPCEPGGGRGPFAAV